MRLHLLLLTAVLCFISCATTKNKQHTINDTRSLITQMKANSTTNWVQTFTFVQSTYRHQQDGTIDTSTWYEAISYPDKFRIDFGDPANGNAVIYRQDSVYQFKKFELVDARPEINDLLLLTGAEMVYPVDTTIDRLQRSGIATALFRKDTFMGKPCYVLGQHNAEDLTSKEIWIEQNRLLVLRKLESSKDGKPLEIQFYEYTKVQDSWIEQWVVILYDNKLLQTERYQEITPRKNLAASVFNPNAMKKLHWYHAPPSEKINFDLAVIDMSGLSGTGSGKVAVDYEFCIPRDEKIATEVKRIDPSLKVLHKGSGRIGCDKTQWLCLGNTHQKNWRSILNQLAAQDYVKRIDQTFFE